MIQKLPIVILEDIPAEMTKIKSAFDFLGVDNPLHFFTDSSEMNKFLNECYPASKTLATPLPAFFLFDFNADGTIALTCLKALKANPLFCSLPVIIFSNSERKDHMADCYANGCAGLFHKPETMEGYLKLLEVIYRFWHVTESDILPVRRLNRYAKIR